MYSTASVNNEGLQNLPARRHAMSPQSSSGGLNSSNKNNNTQRKIEKRGTTMTKTMAPVVLAGPTKRFPIRRHGMNIVGVNKNDSNSSNNNNNNNNNKSLMTGLASINNNILDMFMMKRSMPNDDDNNSDNVMGMKTNNNTKAEMMMMTYARSQAPKCDMRTCTRFVEGVACLIKDSRNKKNKNSTLALHHRMEHCIEGRDMDDHTVRFSLSHFPSFFPCFLILAFFFFFLI